MVKTKRAWDLLTDYQRESYTNEIIAHFNKERDEPMGVIAAEEILDFFLELSAKDLYNKGLQDAAKLLLQRSQDLEVELSILEKK